MSDKKPMPNAILLSAKQGAALCGLSVAYFWKLDSSGRLPPKISLSSNCVRWRKSDLELWVQLGCISREKFIEMRENR